ncbi:MAG: ABC transporter permease [Chloroflexota bacterium]
MLSYVLKRMGLMVPTVIGVVTVVFMMIRLLPGDPVLFMLGDSGNITQESLQEMRERLGLAAPLPVQYVQYLADVVRLDLGESILTGASVTELLWDAIPITMLVAVASVIFAVVVAIPLGALAAYWSQQGKGALDQGVTWFALFTDALPGFWIALVLMLFFSLYLGWFPVSGSINWDEPLTLVRRLALPVVVLGLAQLASVARVTRTAVLEALNEDYVRTSRMLGAPELEVLFKHALRNALLPVVTVLGLSFGRLLGGTIITENVFSIPGMGTSLIQGIGGRDYTVAQGVILVYAMLFILVNLITDVLYTKVDPRVRI